MPSASLHRIVRAAMTPPFPGADILHYNWEVRWDAIMSLRSAVRGMMRQPASAEVLKELGNLDGMLEYEISIWTEVGEIIRKRVGEANVSLGKSLRRISRLDEDWVEDIERLGWSPNAVRVLCQKIQAIGDV